MYTGAFIIIVFAGSFLGIVAITAVLLSKNFSAKYAIKNIVEEKTIDEKTENITAEESSADIMPSSEQTNAKVEYLPITFQNIMTTMRNLPEESDEINAYAGTDVLDDESGTALNSIGDDCLSSFLELVLNHDKFKDRKNTLVNAFFQLYSFDYAVHYEGAYTFFEDTYEENPREDVLLAGNWLNNNDFPELGYYLTSGYESKEKSDIAETWLNAHPAEVYRAYRTIMFLFEEKYHSCFEEE